MRTDGTFAAFGTGDSSAWLTGEPTAQVMASSTVCSMMYIPNGKMELLFSQFRTLANDTFQDRTCLCHGLRILAK